MTPNYAPQSQQSNGLAVASMVLGIVSVALLCFRWVAVPLGVLAIVLAVIAINQAKAGQRRGSGMAKAGLILGIIGPLISIALWIAVVSGLRAGGNFLQQKSKEIQQKAEQMQKDTEAAQKKAEQDAEAARKNTSSTQP
jgi:uncharacterized protein HemX